MSPDWTSLLSIPGDKRCRVPEDVAEVSTVNAAAEIPAQQVGADPEKVAEVWAAVESLYRSGCHPAIQLCVRCRGRVILDRAIGHATGNGPNDAEDEPQVLVTPAMPFNIFSASKAVTAMVVHLLVERRLIDLDEPVCTYVPEFAARGKQRVTVRHVLAHRAGISKLPAEQMRSENLVDVKQTVRVICGLKPEGEPGCLAYHALTGGFILGEVVRRVTGKSIRTVLSNEILKPLGFRWTNFGVARRDISKVVRNYFTGPPPIPPLSTILDGALGVDFKEAADGSNAPRFLTATLPSANIITTAAEMTRFYQLLLDDGKLDGKRIFARSTVRRAVAPQSKGPFELDKTFNLPMRYSLGFMLGGRWVSLFGPDTERVFGHLGFVNIVCWADPERRVAAALMTSGKPLLYPQIYRFFDIPRRIGLACPKIATHGQGPPPGS